MIHSLQDIFAELLIHIPISFNYLFPLDLVELFEKKNLSFEFPVSYANHFDSFEICYWSSGL